MKVKRRSPHGERGLKRFSGNQFEIYGTVAPLTGSVD